MPRTYRVSFEQVAVTAPQDLIQITGVAGKMVRIIDVSVGATPTSLPAAQMIATRCRRLPATVTPGTGGTTPAIVTIDGGDAAASFTALANNTAKATTSGTAVVLMERGDHIYSGCDHVFPVRPPIGVNEAFVFELLSTPAASVTLSGWVEVEEIGG